MSATKILYGVFLCTIFTASTKAQDNPVKLLAGASQGITNLGRHTQCLADKGDTSEIIAQIYHSFDATFAGIKENVKGPITEEIFGALLRILVVDAANNLKAVNIQCNDYCPEDNADFSHTPKEIGDLGKVLENVGLIMSCLLDDPKPEILGQFPVIMGAAMQAVAASTDTSKTSVNIILKENEGIVKGLQKLSSRCVNIKRSC